MIVITTPTGQIGASLVRELLERGESLRVVARRPEALDERVRERVEVVAGSHADPAVLDAALAGADALFWLVPPGRSAAGARAYYLDFTEPAVDAIRRNGVGHVVGVTSAGHGWAGDAGVLSAAFAMDERLAASGAAYRALSLPFYLENLLGQLDAIRDQGFFSLAAPGDRPFATIATDDIAARAAGLLAARDWSGRQDVPLFGPDRLTLEELATVMSEELHRPVAYRPMTIDQLASAMRAGGAGEQAVRDTTEMFAAQVDGIYDADWARAETGRIDARTWCRTVLAPRAGGLS
ncbi:NAD(P)H-binding protein [Leifsonia sp. NPDC080035]|uniref:NAD(P)H-binding protein n=1 Tax=Leifsonia sp. NPDC080035 TaxID=3143936 RepID=A0AAU7GGC6_9MICO